MLAFFYSLFRALMTGSWNMFQTQQINNLLGDLGNKLTSLIVNALGGNFETTQTLQFFTSSLTAVDSISLILAVVAMVMVCLAVFKLTKMVFSIFFGGR